MKRMTSWLYVMLALFLSITTSRAGDPPPAAVQSNRIQFGAPVFVSPTMQWAVPNSTLNGPPANLSGMMMLPPYSDEYSSRLAILAGVGARGSLYDFDWVSYYSNLMQWAPSSSLPAPMQWAVPSSNLNGPPADLSKGMMMMPH